MPRAIWNDVVIAEAPPERVELVEGNVYFPREAVKPEFLLASDTQTVCAWKGTASYFTLAVDGRTNVDAAWFCPAPKEAAKQIKDHVAFWKGVRVES